MERRDRLVQRRALAQENLANYLTKGKQIYVEGRLQTRSYEDKDGKKVYDRSGCRRCDPAGRTRRRRRRGFRTWRSSVDAAQRTARRRWPSRWIKGSRTTTSRSERIESCSVSCR